MKSLYLVASLTLVGCGTGEIAEPSPSHETVIDAGSDSSTECPPQFVDQDQDGYGSASASPVFNCTPLAGYSFTHDDCADEDPVSHPGNTDYFDTPISGTLEQGTDPYDYNCDGKVERRPGPVVDSLRADTPCDQIGCR